MGAAQAATTKRGGVRTRDDPPTRRVMRHRRQPAAGMAPILDAGPHHEEPARRF
jgi:hypothetical protein